jgi:ferredoxin-NADP reductase/MOSC domain-containing protein YiiM/ferredoxin
LTLAGVAELLSLNVGLPRDVAWQGRTVHTGIWKRPVDGPGMVRRLNIDGDGQGDTAGHGGEQRAVLVYQIESYRYWERHFGRSDFSYGQFGENLTVDGLPDDEVCIGDRYRIGEAEFEVTQPRVTCFRVGLRLGQPDLPALLVSHHRPGFYMRVIREGRVQAGDPILKTGTGPGALTVAETDALLYLPGRDPARLRVAVDIPPLSPGWRQSFVDLLAVDDHAAQASGPAWAGFRALQVTDVVPETETVASIYLAAPDGSRLPPARAGQYLTIRVADAGGTAAVRSYSLSSGPGAATYRISVKREPRGLVSPYVHDKLHPGATVEVAAPRGQFVLETEPSPVLLISAGIGVTPVLAMLHQLSEQRSERDVWWIHGARRPAEHALAAEAHTLMGSLAHGHEHVFYSATTAEEARGAGAVPGRLTADRLRRLAVPADGSAYVCGPAAFMADIRDALVAVGVGPSRIHTELFAALDAINPGVTDPNRPAPHPPAGPPGTGPSVTFARSGIGAPFDTNLKSVLEFAEACDVKTRWSCRTGVCHTCVTPLVSGDIVYDPDPLELPAPGQVLICCARPGSAVVFDM